MELAKISFILHSVTSIELYKIEKVQDANRSSLFLSNFTVIKKLFVRYSMSCKRY